MTDRHEPPELPETWGAATPPPPPIPPPPAHLMAPPPGPASGSSTPHGGRPAAVRTLATAIVVLQVVTSALSLVVLGLQIAVADDAGDYRADLLTSDTFRDRLRPYFTAVSVLGFAGTATLVLLIIWTYRLSANLDVVGRQPRTWRRGWGIVVWLLQGCTFSILPYLMLRELWRGSDPDVAADDPSWRQAPIAPVLHVWFALNVAQLVTTSASGFFSFGSFSLSNATDRIAESLDERMPFIVASAALSLLSTIALALVVVRLTARHARTTGAT